MISCFTFCRFLLQFGHKDRSDANGATAEEEEDELQVRLRVLWVALFVLCAYGYAVCCCLAQATFGHTPAPYRARLCIGVPLPTPSGPPFVLRLS